MVIRLYKADLPDKFPSDMLNAELELVMSKNIPQFGNTLWRQLRGTAMGRSTAVNYPNLYVGLLEITRLRSENVQEISPFLLPLYSRRDRRLAQ